MRPAGLLALALLLLGLALGGGHAQLTSPASESSSPCRASAKPMARLELLFGTSRRQGAPISEEEWTSFLDTEVTPRFPDGLTVLSGPGQWRGTDGLVARERSMMLLIWYDPTSLADGHVESIRSAFKQRFNQESVMRVDGVSCVSF